MKGGLERCQTRGCRKDCSGVPLLPRVLTATAPGEDFGSGSSSPSNRESSNERIAGHYLLRWRQCFSLFAGLRQERRAKGAFSCGYAGR